MAHDRDHDVGPGPTPPRPAPPSPSPSPPQQPAAALPAGGGDAEEEAAAKLAADAPAEHAAPPAGGAGGAGDAGRWAETAAFAARKWTKIKDPKVAKGIQRIPTVGRFKRTAATNLAQYVKAQTGRPKTCKPFRKVIYLKTHKTGSSTLANIFHRAAVTLGARVVLPKGDLFLGWPDSRGIANSFNEVPNVTEYDMFISAHSRYNEELIAPIVPGSQRVTVLRNPRTHFLSSYEYVEWSSTSTVPCRRPLAVLMPATKPPRLPRKRTRIAFRTPATPRRDHCSSSTNTTTRLPRKRALMCNPAVQPSRF